MTPLDRVLASGFDEMAPSVTTLLEPGEVDAARLAGKRIFRVLARVSDDKLSSIPQQLRDCYAYAEQQGAVVDRFYNLGEHSGFKVLESEVYNQMIRDVVTESFDAVVARDTSRLGRDMGEKLALLVNFRRGGKEVHVIAEGGFIDAADDRELLIQSVNAYADSAKKKEEIKKSVRATAMLRDDRFPTTSIPFGYESARHESLRRRVWKPTGDAAKVTRAFEAVDSAADVNLSELAREIGVSFHRLRYMLRNRAYTGGFLWHGSFRTAPPEIIPPLVDTARFERVQKRLARKSK
ncbi:MAG: recombinase family protein [Thermoplasmatota archaeon]